MTDVNRWARQRWRQPSATNMESTVGLSPWAGMDLTSSCGCQVSHGLPATLPPALPKHTRQTGLPLVYTLVAPPPPQLGNCSAPPYVGTSYGPSETSSCPQGLGRDGELREGASQERGPLGSHPGSVSHELEATGKLCHLLGPRSPLLTMGIKASPFLGRTTGRGLSALQSPAKRSVPAQSH